MRASTGWGFLGVMNAGFVTTSLHAPDIVRWKTRSLVKIGDCGRWTVMFSFRGMGCQIRQIKNDRRDNQGRNESRRLAAKERRYIAFRRLSTFRAALRCRAQIIATGRTHARCTLRAGLDEQRYWNKSKTTATSQSGMIISLLAILPPKLPQC